MKKDGLENVHGEMIYGAQMGARTGVRPDDRT